MKKHLLLLCALVALIPSLCAQVTTEPYPLQEDSRNVEIYFHADEGTKGLMGQPASAAIYAHTGIQVETQDGKTEDWKYAPTWLDNAPKYKLQYVRPNLWKLNIGDIRTYYGVAATETVKKLCFVFRNATGSLQGKASSGNGDIYVDVVDKGFQIVLQASPNTNIVTASTGPVIFTAATTSAADIQIYVNASKIGEAKSATVLKSSYTFTSEGNYDVKAVATRGSETIEEHMAIVYAPSSPAATDKSVPPMGLTKNPDGSYTFCVAAPEKTSAMIVGSWNGYTATTDGLMEYVDGTLDGGTFRYFKKTLPASVTGTEFGYYYLVDATIAVGDPYARLVLDPDNDKYISASVYPNLPAYPADKVPANTPVAWHSDTLLDYSWSVQNFKGADKDNLIIYELLIRDFTGTEGKADGNGTVRGVIDKLGYLMDLGVNAIELLPINEFNGNISWGYNPNFYFAIDKAYGTPQDYKELIDKCHQAGIAVILDMVFNQSDWLHPWYRMYPVGSNPFYNATAPHAYSVLNDWNQGYPLVGKQWEDVLKFWLKEYKVDGFRFDLVKGLGDNSSYANSGDAATNAYNASRVARMKRLHAAMKEVNPDAYFINENLAFAQEENEMAADGELNWANVNNAGMQYAMGYPSDSALSRMWAVKDERTAGSTVAYLESHDEQRLAYQQNQYGIAGVKGNHQVSMRRLGSAAAQMILVPGAHMIWQFSEMGNAENTKNAYGNNVDPKIVNWNLLNDPDNAGLMQNYQELINLRLKNPDLFANPAYTFDLAQWNSGRWIMSVLGDKELYVVINPNVTGSITSKAPFKIADNNSYYIASKSYGSNPVFSASAQTVTVEPNCYVVIVSDSVTEVKDIVADSESTAVIYPTAGGITVENYEGPVSVYSLGGGKVAAGHGAGTLSVAPGIYVVRAGERAVKVVVH